jgi:hypothetical protein
MKKQKVILTPKQKEFAKVKRFVMKRFPGAHTIAKTAGEGRNKYVVVDDNGFAVVNGELMIPLATSVRKAWDDAKYSIWFTNMIRKSNAAFNEEKIFKKLAKESGE